MNTEKSDQTTTIAITLHVKERLAARKLIRDESWNSVIQRMDEQLSAQEATKRMEQK